MGPALADVVPVNHPARTGRRISSHYGPVMLYGPVFKDVAHELFGDGIMSAIDFDMTIERQPDPKGDRVKVTMCGKFLPYKEY